jgi:predicted nucleic acid-binding protein
MPYLIDTDWAIDYLTGIPEALALLDRLTEEGIAISVITYMEIYQGVLRTPDPFRTEEGVAAFLEGVPVAPLSLAVARRCARLRESLRREGRQVQARALDLLVAATALEHDLILVTRNRDDYQDIPGLKLSP